MTLLELRKLYNLIELEAYNSFLLINILKIKLGKLLKNTLNIIIIFLLQYY